MFAGALHEGALSVMPLQQWPRFHVLQGLQSWQRPLLPIMQDCRTTSQPIVLTVPNVGYWTHLEGDEGRGACCRNGSVRCPQALRRDWPACKHEWRNGWPELAVHAASKSLEAYLLLPKRPCASLAALLERCFPVLATDPRTAYITPRIPAAQQKPGMHSLKQGTAGRAGGSRQLSNQKSGWGSTGFSV